jgi:hypothetical protein
LPCGWRFDNTKERTAISLEVHCKFCHAFIAFASTVLHTKYVLTPVYLDEAQLNMAEYEESGFLGFVGSSD